MKVIIDRFEDEKAILELEAGSNIEVPKILVNEFKEGDVIDITLNKEETKNRSNKINELMNSLFE